MNNFIAKRSLLNKFLTELCMHVCMYVCTGFLERFIKPNRKFRIYVLASYLFFYNSTIKYNRKLFAIIQWYSSTNFDSISFKYCIVERIKILTFLESLFTYIYKSTCFHRKTHASIVIEEWTLLELRKHRYVFTLKKKKKEKWKMKNEKWKNGNP